MPSGTVEGQVRHYTNTTPSIHPLSLHQPDDFLSSHQGYFFEAFNFISPNKRIHVPWSLILRNSANQSTLNLPFLHERSLRKVMTDGPPSSSAASLAFRPSSVAPPPTTSHSGPSSAEISASENNASNGVRGGRGGHGRGRLRGRGRGNGRAGNPGQGREQRTADEGLVHGQAPHRDGLNRGAHVDGHGAIAVAGRQFGGRLTENAETSMQSFSSLQGDAPAFVPRQQHQQRLKAPKSGRNGIRGGRQSAQHPENNPRSRRASIAKSNAQDIATRTHEDITNGVYECPICTAEVERNSKVWSCHTCWTVFHLSCIKKWSTNEGSTLGQQQAQHGDLPPPRQWRCPGCNLPKDVLPSTYTCWCEKEADPRSTSGIPPHSCGQTCGKSRILPKKCPHPCDLLCHAGPCPPCKHAGPVQSCFCGKRSISRRCVDTDYDSGWTCGEICGDLMPCGEHTCERPCHEGLCGACEVWIDCRCYCGKEQRSVPCCERGEEKQSKRTTEEAVSDEWTGMFECGSSCERLFDCGKHRCERRCHTQELHTPHCPWSPDVVTRCPCGKSLLEDISSTRRETCEDSIPICDKQCSKPLECGHPCQQVCHPGECMPCFLKVEISCRCGRTKSTSICHQGTEEPPQCMRTCKAILNCGRHECGERCCQGERKAAERQATKRKLRPLGASRIIEEGFEAEHICTRTCGRSLKCGNHTCPELCHKGPCGTCREAIFDEISCNCGRTILQPPLPCGTSVPPCRFDCERHKPCGHPKVPHSCHGDETSCPKCPFLEPKICMCGKQTLKNQPCWLADVRCGEVCGKKLRCGSHFCRKQCHRGGECEDADKHCQQACGKAKKSCGHPCEENCHAPSPCKEDKPCQNKMLITCDCQHLKQEIRCNASKTSDGNSNKTLFCDDECARLARNHRLALALNVDPEAHKDDRIPYSNDTLKMFRENSKWAQIQEREFRVFAADESEKRLRFKPMPPHQRAFLHSLSEDFGLDSESMDPEPYRHVAVFKTPRFVMAPMKSLQECVRIRANHEAASIQESQKKLQTTNIPYNGFLLSSPRFGLTLDELHSDFASSFSTTPGLVYNISFLPSEEIVIKAQPASASTAITDSAIEASLKALHPSISSINSSKRLAQTVQLCSLDSSLNILRRELDEFATNGGWSQVAAKAAAPRFASRQTAVGEKSVYTVLGSKLRDAKKKKEELKRAKETEVVVDNWEEAVDREEQKERQKLEAVSGGEAIDAQSGSGAEQAIPA